MLMMKSMLRKTLNGINDLIVYKFVSNKDKKKKMLKLVPYFLTLLERKKRQRATLGIIK